MPLETFDNGESLASVRAKLNATIEEANRLPIAARLSISGNATATTFPGVNTFAKIAGVNAGAQADAGLEVANNRITHTLDSPRRYAVTALASVFGGANDVIAVRIAKNGTTCPLCDMESAMPSGSRPTSGASQGYFTLEQGDYVEVWAANRTDASPATFRSLSLMLVEIKTPNGP